MKDKQNLDPKGRYLIQDGGTIYVYTDKLAKRKDMRPYDVKAGGPVVEPTESTGEKKVEIELQGKSFMVEQGLYDVLTDMAGVMADLQKENKALKANAADFEATKERLTTDIFDLTEQLANAKGEIGALKGLPPEPPTHADDEVIKDPEGKGKKKTKKVE